MKEYQMINYLQKRLLFFLDFKVDNNNYLHQ